jgi:predicted GNAT superfamily acetyltransferase
MSSESPVIIKPIITNRDIRWTQDIQRNVWGYRDAAIIPPTQLISAQRNGGLVLGAYLEGQMVGFVYGYLGLSGDKLYMFSQRMGVLRSLQGKGIGLKLKLAQREATLAQGIDTIVWTYDPLEGKNATLNIEKLGGFVRTYIRDAYGRVDNPLQAGLATDRFMVEWPLNSERTLAHLRGDIPRPTTAELENIYRPVNYANWASTLPRPIAADLDLDEPVLLVHVPANLHAIRRKDLKIAAGWRNTTRVIFESYFKRGYAVTSFASDRDLQTPNIYKLEKTNFSTTIDFSKWITTLDHEEDTFEDDPLN